MDNIATLEDLCVHLNEFGSTGINMQTLPTFGGEAPADNDGAWSHGVWSWDDTRLLIEEDGEYLIIGRNLK